MASSIVDLGAMLSPSNLLQKGAGAAKAATAKDTASTSTTSTSGLTGTTTGTTFLNLLVKELQNQDPTAPMDSTAMVGQMISLNQLDQLISINQVLSTATGSTSTATSATSDATSAVSSAAQIAQRTALLTSLQQSSAAASDPTQALDLSTLSTSIGGK